MVTMLVDRGADMDVPNIRGMPPLLCAAKAGHWELVELLLQRGAPIEQKVTFKIFIDFWSARKTYSFS